MTAKPISPKRTGGKSGGCARKAVELTSGDPPLVTEDGAIHLDRGAGVSSGHSRPQAHKGSPGIDGMKVSELPGYLKQHWPFPPLLYNFPVHGRAQLRLLTFLILSFGLAVHAEPIKDLKPTGYVNDFAHVLDSPTTSQM